MRSTPTPALTDPIAVVAETVVGEDNLGPIGVRGSRSEGWWSASNSGVVGDRGAAQAYRVIALAVLYGVVVVGVGGMAATVTV